MTDDQVERIQSYQGDIVEEYWKPGSFRSNRSYVDLFRFWEFRDSVKACGLEHLRPSQGQCISRTFIFKHERLASYYYSAYCRVASLHQCLLDLENQIARRDNLLYFLVQHSFESFYLFLGSALDSIGGVGNIMFGYHNSEDSFSDFLRSFRADALRIDANPNAIALFDAARDIQDNYRSHIAHRGRLATIWGSKLNVLFPNAPAEFERPGPADASVSWRKDIRDMIEGRARTLPMTQLCFKHLRAVELAIDEIYRISTTEINSYLLRHNVQFAAIPSDFDCDVQQVPADARWILYRCNQENRPYLNMWFHELARGEPPTHCINVDCGSDNITPMYFVRD
jgi:hypothetical protein